MKKNSYSVEKQLVCFLAAIAIHNYYKNTYKLSSKEQDFQLKPKLFMNNDTMTFDGYTSWTFFLY